MLAAFQKKKPGTMAGRKSNESDWTGGTKKPATGIRWQGSDSGRNLGAVCDCGQTS